MVFRERVHLCKELIPDTFVNPSGLRTAIYLSGLKDSSTSDTII